MEEMVIYVRAAWRMWINEIKWRLKRSSGFPPNYRRTRMAYWEYPIEERFHWCMKLIKARLENTTF